MNVDHDFIPQPGCNVCVCGAPEHEHCSHHWPDCPVHNPQKVELPPFNIVLLCVYGGAETKAGHPFGASDADEVAQRIADRLWGEAQP